MYCSITREQYVCKALLIIWQKIWDAFAGEILLVKKDRGNVNGVQICSEKYVALSPLNVYLTCNAV